MTNSEKKLLAFKMRRQGKSIGEISTLLKISKGSASAWVSGIVLTKAQKEKLKRKSIEAGSLGRLKGALMNKNKRLSIISKYQKEGVETLGVLSERDMLLVAAGLFWSEGGKTGSRFIFINSDPDMVKLMFNFLTKFWNIDKSRIKITIQVNVAHKERIDKILIFWSNLLKLPCSQFNKPYYVKTRFKKVYDNHDSYFGTVRMNVVSGSSLLYRMMGVINAIKK